MKILALESSATACSVALCEDEALIAQSFQNNGLTHSRTLMPMAVSLLDNCRTALDAVELIAVAAGPAPSPACASASPPPRGWPGRGTSPARPALPWSPWPGVWPTWTGRSVQSWMPAGTRSTTPASARQAATWSACAPTGPWAWTPWPTS